MSDSKEQLNERKGMKPDEVNLHPWWEVLDAPRASGGYDPFKEWAQSGLLFRSIQTGTTFYKGSASGLVGNNAKLIIDGIEQRQLGRRICEDVCKDKDSPSKFVWAWADGASVVRYWDGE